jgi:Flp pilus assembly pilin Flp
MQHFRLFLRLIRDENATASVEYAVMLAMILLVVILAVSSFGGAGNSMFGRIDTQMKSHGIN